MSRIQYGDVFCEEEGQRLGLKRQLCDQVRSAEEEIVRLENSLQNLRIREWTLRHAESRTTIASWARLLEFLVGVIFMTGVAIVVPSDISIYVVSALALILIALDRGVDRVLRFFSIHNEMHRLG